MYCQMILPKNMNWKSDSVTTSECKKEREKDRRSYKEMNHECVVQFEIATADQALNMTVKITVGFGLPVRPLCFKCPMKTKFSNNFKIRV